MAVFVFFLAANAVAAPVVLTHGRFRDVSLYKPKGEPQGLVLFLSGDGGWNPGVISMAKALADRGMLVAGINTPALLKTLEADGASCEFADGDLENLSHFLQACAGLPG